MELYSGRLDITCKPETIKHLASFYKCYGSNEHDFIVCYEEKTKAGLPCKPHVHFLFYSTAAHDRMRKTLSGYGYKGPLGSLSQVSKNAKWSKETTYSYVMKQQDVILTNLTDDDLKDLKATANQINQQIKEKMTTFNQHWEIEITRQLIDNDIVERPHIIIFTHKYITRWNSLQQTKAPNEMDALINYPSRNQLLSLIVHFEGKYLPEEIAISRYLEDMGYSSAHHNLFNI